MARYIRPMISRTSYDKPHQNFFAEYIAIKLFEADTAITLTDTFAETVTPPARGDLWMPLTPVVKDGTSGKWRVWKDTDTTVEGFLLGPEGLSDDYHGRPQFFASLDVGHRVMLKGTIDMEAIPQPPGTTLNLLKAACANTTRERGIIVIGTEIDWH
jgi:hypothetical protein